MAGRLVLLNGRIADHKYDEGGRTTMDMPIGVVAVDDRGDFYRYVLNEADLAIDQYDSACYDAADISNFAVQADYSAATAAFQNRPAGTYGQSTQIAVDEYFWIQISGYATGNTETVTPVVGDPCILHATDDGELDNGLLTTAEAEHPFRWMGAFLATETAGTPDTAPIVLRGLI